MPSLTHLPSLLPPQGVHSDDILCLAVHPNGRLVATGEVGRKPKIVVWDVDSKDVKAVLEGHLTRGVALLAFDKSTWARAEWGQEARWIFVTC